jgi:3-hydroxybutyrate dehydrogenase
LIRTDIMTLPLKDQVAVVTGSGRGIGRETAIELARAGARVVLASRTSCQLDEVAETISAENGTALAVPTDVADPESVSQLVANTVNNFGRLDILVNCAAGKNYISSLPFSDDARWKKMFEVNVFGVYLCTKAALPHMIRAKSGRIINISSVAGVIGAAHNSAYSASKAAVLGFTKAVALEVAPLGITCNAICPWHVDTELMREAMSQRAALFGSTTEEYIAKVAATNPQRRLITVAEIAGLTVFLTMPAARGINGQTLNQCGGIVTS